MRQKRLMLLGGLRYLLPVIDAAHKQGYYVITADYLPDNFAHKHSDEYCNVSVIDKDAVLQAAKRLDIDGIMSFAVDPGVVSAAYVQHKLGLPSFGPYESVCILQNKDRFRKFLADNNFNVPQARSYDNVDDALADTGWITWPMIVKPTDSAGSKGVTRVDDIGQYAQALAHAFDNSPGKKVIVEQFIEKQGCSSDTDSFSVNGNLVFTTFNAQRFDTEASNPYVPASYSWPSTFTPQQEAYLKSEIQRLLTLLNMNTAIYNIETRVGTDGKAYIMEVTPRGGGNRLAEMIRHATGVDMITACVRAAVGDTIDEISQTGYNGNWAEIILHAPKAGIFNSLDISDTLAGHVVETDLWVSQGDDIRDFNGANDAIGTLVLRFDTQQQLADALLDIHSLVKVNVTPHSPK